MRIPKERHPSRRVRMATGSVLLALTGHVCANEIPVQECLERAAPYFAESHSPADAAEAVIALRRMGSVCQGTGYYETILAQAMISAGDIGGARQQIAAGLRVPDSDKSLLYEVLFRLHAQTGSIEEIHVLAERLIADQPQDSSGYMLRAKYHAYYDDPRLALPDLLKVLDTGTDSEQYAAHRLLIAVFWKLDMFSRVVNSFEEAKRRSDLIYDDPELVRVAAISYYLTGHYRQSAEVLQLLLREHRGSANHQHVRFLIEDLALQGIEVAMP